MPQKHQKCPRALWDTYGTSWRPGVGTFGILFRAIVSRSYLPHAFKSFITDVDEPRDTIVIRSASKSVPKVRRSQAVPAKYPKSVRPLRSHRSTNPLSSLFCTHALTRTAAAGPTPAGQLIGQVHRIVGFTVISWHPSEALEATIVLGRGFQMPVSLLHPAFPQRIQPEPQLISAMR